MNKDKKQKMKPFTMVIIGCAILTVGYIGLYFGFCYPSVIDNHELSWGDFGSYLGGLGGLLSFATLIFLLWTNKQDKEKQKLIEERKLFFDYIDVLKTAKLNIHGMYKDKTIVGLEVIETISSEWKAIERTHNRFRQIDYKTIDMEIFDKEFAIQVQALYQLLLNIEPITHAFSMLIDFINENNSDKPADYLSIMYCYVSSQEVNIMTLYYCMVAKFLLNKKDECFLDLQYMIHLQTILPDIQKTFHSCFTNHNVKPAYNIISD